MAGSNPKVRLARALIARRKDRWEEHAFVAQGSVLVEEAIRAGVGVRFILCRDDIDFECFDIDVFEVEPRAFDDLNDTTTPQGVLAVCDMPRTVPIASDNAWYLVAHGISDPGNLGTLIRSAEASGATGVVVTHGTADPFSPKSVRASAGAIFHVPVVFVRGLDDGLLGELELIGTTSHDGPMVDDLWNADVAGSVGIVFGGEAHGLAIHEPVSRWIRIPHAGRSESLNVAMAAAVVAMHVGRTRN